MPPASFRRLLAGLLAVAALYFLSILTYQVALVVDPAYQSTGISPLFKYRLDGNPQNFGSDYLAGFAGAFTSPLLYEWMTRAWVRAGGDLVFLHRLIPLACWLAFLAGLAVAARTVGDRITLIGTVGLAVAQPLYLLQMTSALPHAFGFPLVAWSIVALLKGWGRALGLITLLAGLLYPAVAPLAGLLFAWRVILEGRLWRQDNRARAQGLIAVAVIGVLSLWLVLEAMRGPADLGPALVPGEKAELYPENSPEGRLNPIPVTSPVTYLAARVYFQFREVFAEDRLLLLFFYFCVGIYGITALPKSSSNRQAVFATLACAVVASLVVLAVVPHFVYRFAFYPGFTLLPLLFVLGVQQFCRSFAKQLPVSQLASLALILLFSLSLDSFKARNTGYLWHLGPASRQVLDFAAAQPPGSRFAVWPERTNRFELIPYLAERPLLVMLQLHAYPYEGHLLEMRARMNALIDAYLARDEAPLRALHCDWQVDYLIVDKAHFAEDAEAPWYFAPFDKRIAQVWNATDTADFLLRAPPPDLVALETANNFVLRLEGPCASESSLLRGDTLRQSLR